MPLKVLDPVGAVTQYMGVAVYDYPDYRSIADFIRAVDNAMYEGKRSGKNRVIVSG